MLLSGEEGHEDEHMNEAEDGEKEKDDRKMRIDWYGAPEFQWRSKKTKEKKFVSKVTKKGAGAHRRKRKESA